MERRLVAILAADAVGYSRLVGEDEEGTLRTLGTCRKVIDGLVAEHRGRVFGSAGDSVVAEFASPVEAVRCAADIQRDFERRNAALPEDRQMRFRIGINLGDVIVEGDDLLGDGVNVAARLEALAEAGGICLSQPVFDQIKNKLELGYAYLGEQAIKNIAEPVRVYRVLLEPEASGTVIDEAKRNAQLRKWAALTAAMILVIGAVVGVAWLRPWAPDVEPASLERMAFPLPDKPSIAVLPFTNMSGDPEQEYFADGMTEDLITDLSKISGLFIIARKSTFIYKGETVTIRQVAEELGVRYVLEGSVRRTGDQVRINAQLIDATTGGHVWAERYDSSLTNVFALQDKVTQNIVTALQVKLTPAEEDRLSRQLTNNPEAYDYYIRSLRQESFFTKEGNLESLRMLERAIELDPTFARAYGRLATAHTLAADNGWSTTPEQSMETARLLAERAVALDDDLPQAHWAVARIYSRKQLFDGDRALASLRRAITLDPNYADAHAMLSNVLVRVGRAEEALGHVERAMRLNPNFPFWYYEVLGTSQFMLTRYDAAVESYQKAIERNSTYPPSHRMLIASYGHLGQTDNAEWEIQELAALGYELTLNGVRKNANIAHPASLQRYLDGLRKAGVPEE